MVRAEYRRLVWFLASALLIIPCPAGAATYLVNPDGTGDFPTIQAAIFMAADGDVIELSDGTFTGGGNRNIDYLGKAITLRSQSGDPLTCVIDCDGSEESPQRGFYFHSGEGAESVLEGVTVKNGYMTGGTGVINAGGAVHCDSTTSPAFHSCVFANNHAEIGGGGAFCEKNSPTFTDCLFAHNSGDSGAGLWCQSAAPIVTGCSFVENEATYAAAIACFWSSAPQISECYFLGNIASSSGGVAYS